MTEKEFKKLKRGDLVAIIYEYQKKQDALVKENEELKLQLGAKELKIKEAGSIAEAVVRMNSLFETAQKTADDYLEHVKLSVKDAEKKAEEIIAEAKKKAEEIVREAENRKATPEQDKASDEVSSENKDNDNEPEN